MGLGGGIFGGQGYTTFSPETANDETQEVHAQAIRDLIARDKNHPSVVLWSIANEPESETEAAENYFRPLFEVARKADPTRPVGFVNVMLAPYGKCRVSQFADVLMLNRYYGWYVQTGDLDAAEAAWEEELTGWASENKPIIITEYGADTYPGLHSVAANSPWTEEYQVEYLDMNHRVFDRIDAVVGEQVWNFADFTTTSGDHAGRRQQEGRLHPGPAAEGRRARAAPPVAQRPRLSSLDARAPRRPVRSAATRRPKRRRCDGSRIRSGRRGRRRPSWPRPASSLRGAPVSASSRRRSPSGVVGAPLRC